MKYRLIALILLVPLAAQAASPEESYFAARDGYIQKFKSAGTSGKIDDRTLNDEKRARGDLEQQLRRIVGPFNPQGFSGLGKSNLASLFEGDEDFGLLDGLVFSSKNGKTRVLVTTSALTDNWLRAHKNSQSGRENLPEPVDAALKSNAFYTQALNTDAAFSRYALLPITKPAQATFAFAMLGARSQDIGPRMPDEIVVSVVEADRLFVVTAPANAKIKPMPTCMAVWRKSERKAKQVLAVYTASNPKDQKLFDQYTRTQQEGDDAFRRCYAENAGRDPLFATLTRQAQALVDLVQAK
jgi:hypothetical protein